MPISQVWPSAHAFFKKAAASPAGVVDGSLHIELDGADAAPTPAATASQEKRSARHSIDMQRIRAKASGDALVERLLTAAFSAMADATENHASEWLPGGASVPT